jgi:hypothetical protein
MNPRASSGRTFERRAIDRARPEALPVRTTGTPDRGMTTSLRREQDEPAG